MKLELSRSKIVAAARGDIEADILIRNVNLVNVLTAQLMKADIGIVDDRIAFVLPSGQAADGKTIIEGAGLYAVPGLIDGHVHNESSMVTPANWAKVLLLNGTTTVFTDPHEITNVLGLPGIKYMIDASRGLPLRYYITAPSCVPAVPSKETAGAVITWKEMEQILSWERVRAVAEAMDFPGLIHQTGNITPIVDVAHKREIGIEGHSPGVMGRDLQAYLAATGPLGSDHESFVTDEMLEKVRSGMVIYARCNLFTDNSKPVAKALWQVEDTRMFGLCTDDILPQHLKYGHLNAGIKRLLGCGVDPITAIQMATINNAQHYHLYGLGAIAPGWFADIVLLDDLEKLNVQHVMIDGKIVVLDGKLVVDIHEPVEPLMTESVKLPQGLAVDDFRRFGGGSGKVRFNGMDFTNPHPIPTIIQAEVKDDLLTLPLPDGVAIAAIVPRHGQGTPPSLCLVRDFGLQRGAIASTVSHDSHNLVIIGKDPGDMLAVTEEIKRIGGGLTAVLDGKVLASVPLPIAGLMSPLEVDKISAEMEQYEKCMPDLGMPPKFPTALFVLALPVGPEISLTDRGLVERSTQNFIPIIADQ